MMTGALTFAFLLFAALMGYRLATRFSVRAPNDVFPFLISIDMEAMHATFHPEVEDHYRAVLSAQEFKQMQWKRFHLAVHYSKMVSNNASVLLGWARYERRESWHQLDQDLQKTVFALRSLCMRCRLSSLVIRVRLRWWLLRMMLLPFSPPPTFRTLLHLGSADMISFYANLRNLAEAFSRVYGKDYHQKLADAL
jgi:hypothetical protein